MRFYNGDNFVHHFALIKVLLCKGVKRKIFIQPNPAKPFLADSDHGAHNLKAAKTVVEPLKPQHSLLEQVQCLTQRHLVNEGKF